MNECPSNGLDVVLVKDPTCLKRQDTCPRRWWNRFKQRVVYSGPSLLARITYPCSLPSTPTPQLPEPNTQRNYLSEGIGLTEEGVVQFRSHKIDGCRGCPVRIFDKNMYDTGQNRTKGSTCGTMVKFTTETIDSSREVRDGASVVCVTVRLASTTTTIGVKGREQIELLSKAKCLNLDHFDVKPIQDSIDLG